MQIRGTFRSARKRLKFLLPATGAAVLLAAALFISPPPRRAPRPTIILISIDTLRADRLGCYGCPTGTSPHIDAFSRDSVQFMRAISQAPTTATSHMSLFTGLLPPVHRVSSLLRVPERAKQLRLSSLGAGIPTLAQYLKENGYRTVGLHNGGLVSSYFGFDRGFDRYTAKRIPWQQLSKNPAPLQIIKKLLRSDRNIQAPLFLFLHNYICHAPYTKAPRKIRERFLPDPEPGLPIEWGGAGESFWDKNAAFWNAIDGNNEAHRRHVRALYDAGVNYADWIFGEIVALLKENGSYENSLIAVVSDHGEEFWEHGDTGHKCLWIETLHVPLLIKFPGGEYGGKKVGALVGQFDLMPTLLDYLRIRPRLKLQSRSLLPHIRGQGAASGRVLSFDDSLQFVRIMQGRFVYSNGAQLKPGHWLFNGSNDPGEQHNLAAADMRAVSQMRALAARITYEQRGARARIKAAVPGSPGLPEDLRKQLAALGYL
jgi:arylsulfatase A-like enzyme